MRTLDVDVTDGGDRPVLRAGAENAGLFAATFAVAVAVLTLVDGRGAAPVGVPVCLSMAGLFAWQYSRTVCRYHLSPDGLTITTPLRDRHWPIDDLAQLEMRDWWLDAGRRILVRCHRQRLARSFFVSDPGFGMTPSDRRLPLSVMEAHFNGVARELLAARQGTSIIGNVVR